MSKTTPSTLLQRGISPEDARQRIDSFARNFGKPHLDLAYHAAFPLVLTPDLLYRLHANFPRNVSHEPLHIPWVAVADLLLSTLCESVGHELYEMNVTLRNELLKDLQSDPKFGKQRIYELSDFLLVYVQQQLKHSDRRIRTIAYSQYWTALAYTNPGKAATQLAEALSKMDWNNKAEQLRMASLVETLAEPLEGFFPLLSYTRGIGYRAYGDLEAASVHFIKAAGQEPSIDVQGVRLPIPELRHVEEDLLTVREVAALLRVDDTTVRRWIKNGVLEAIILPYRGRAQTYRIRRSTVDALLTPTQHTANNM